MRACSQCGKEKDPSEFYTGRGNCKACQIAAAKASYERDPGRKHALVAAAQRAKQEYIDSKKAAPCQDCGGSYPTRVMHFHHRDPATKSFALGRGRFCSTARIDAEIAKCDLLCANCHALRH